MNYGAGRVFAANVYLQDKLIFMLLLHKGLSGGVILADICKCIPLGRMKVKGGTRCRTSAFTLLGVLEGSGFLLECSLQGKNPGLHAQDTTKLLSQCPEAYLVSSECLIRPLMKTVLIDSKRCWSRMFAAQQSLC